MNRISIKTKLADMLCHQLKNKVESNDLTDYQALLDACSHWTERHYQLASELIEVSNSTLRRVYLPENYDISGFNQRTKSKYCVFLGYEKWEDLMQVIENQIIEEEIQKRQNFS